LRSRLQMTRAGWRRTAGRIACSAAAFAVFVAIALAPAWLTQGVVAPASVTGIAAALVLAIAWINIRTFVRSSGGFVSLVEYEEEQRTAGLRSVYREYVQKPPSRRARPLWLARRSTPLPFIPFAGEGRALADVLLKATLRRPAH